MSISTRGGDDGTTALAFNRRVPKTHPRVRAYGAVDEFTACLGVARAHIEDPTLNASLRNIQKDILRIMAMLAVDDQDKSRMGPRYNPIKEDDIGRLDALVSEIEATVPPLRDWVIAGDDPATAHLHHARTVCRRAEREIVAAREAGNEVESEIVRYMNRLSDVLWLIARRLSESA